MSVDACQHDWLQIAKPNPLIPNDKGRWRCRKCNAPSRTIPVQLRR